MKVIAAFLLLNLVNCHPPTPAAVVAFLEKAGISCSLQVVSRILRPLEGHSVEQLLQKGLLLMDQKSFPFCSPTPVSSSSCPATEGSFSPFFPQVWAEIRDGFVGRVYSVPENCVILFSKRSRRALFAFMLSSPDPETQVSLRKDQDLDLFRGLVSRDSQKVVPTFVNLSPDRLAFYLHERGKRLNQADLISPLSRVEVKGNLAQDDREFIVCTRKLFGASPGRSTSLEEDERGEEEQEKEQEKEPKGLYWTISVYPEKRKLMKPCEDENENLPENLNDWKDVEWRSVPHFFDIQPAIGEDYPTSTRTKTTTTRETLDGGKEEELAKDQDRSETESEDPGHKLFAENLFGEGESEEAEEVDEAHAAVSPVHSSSSPSSPSSFPLPVVVLVPEVKARHNDVKASKICHTKGGDVVGTQTNLVVWESDLRVSAKFTMSLSVQENLKLRACTSTSLVKRNLLIDLRQCMTKCLE